MKLRRASQLFSLVLVLVLAAALAPAASAAAKNTAAARAGKMIFLPFTVKTQPPQEHLRAGLTSILATRLEERTGLDAVHGADKTAGLEAALEKGSQPEVRKMLKAMQGDCLLAGSLEQQAKGYELRIHVFSGAKAAPSSFKRDLETLDKALPALDELASEIADKIFRQKPDEAEESFPAAAAKNDGMSGFQTSHPDRAWRDGLYAASGQTEAAPASGGDGGLFKQLNNLNSGELELSLKALEAGDLDGDGSEELVLLEQGRLLLCRFNADRFQQIAELPLPGHLSYHAAQLFDMDGDRRPELYLSASNGETPSSLVLRWNGKDLRVMNEQVPFYLRTDIDSAGRPVLLGQAGNGIYRIMANNEGYLVRAEEVTAPQGLNLHDFVRADLDRDGRREFVALTEDNKLAVFDQAGRPLWKSEDSYGASRDALGTLASRQQTDQAQPYDSGRLYLHTRLIAQDLTGDGKSEIVVGRNRVTSVKYFKRLRWFEGSSVAVLSWDGSKMNTLWESGHVPAYTVDYQVLPSVEQPGRFRLFAAESTDSGNPLYFWAKEKAVVRMQELTGAVRSR